MPEINDILDNKYKIIRRLGGGGIGIAIGAIGAIITIICWAAKPSS